MFLLKQTTHRMTIRHDAAIGHMWVPNQYARIPHERGAYVVRTNAQGFRSDRDFTAARGDRPRILFFGDSMTAGDGCANHERFTELVGDALGAEVYNYALSGTGTDQQLLILEQHAAGVEADLVVLCVTVSNIERIAAAYRPTIDRATGRRLLVPKPYFTLDGGGLHLHNVPVPATRHEQTGGGRIDDHETHRRRNPHLKPLYWLSNTLKRRADLDRVYRFLSPRGVEDDTRLRNRLLRLSGFRPHPDFDDPSGPACRLLEAIIRRFGASVGGRPLLVLAVPNTRPYLIAEQRPAYQAFIRKLADSAPGFHVGDLTDGLLAVPWEARKRIPFRFDSHFSPEGHRKVAELVVEAIASRNLLAPGRGVRTQAARTAPAEPKPVYVLGLSCLYHDSAAALIKDGQVVAAAEEERFTRKKNDRRFPVDAINFCLEQGRIEPSDLAAVVYYDHASLTFERLMQTAVAAGGDARSLWDRMVPSWVDYKLHVPALVRRHLNYRGPVLQDLHHRSHAASAFYGSPYDEAAILTIDGVGEWATATIGYGRGSEFTLLKELRFPHSLGLLYSAFTQFTGFKVNDGEYKMMGLAPYGRPVYVDTIRQHLVDVKEDGSIVLNMEYFSFLTGARMTNERFAALFGGPARARDARITQREMDIARSIQVVTEEVMLRMAREARRLTGAAHLVLAGGVALNCVGNGRILREGPFEDVWIQPAAGDAGAALGAALDVYHSYLGRPRALRSDGRPLQGGSYLGPEFSDDEVLAFLETFGHPARRLAPAERPGAIADALASGKVVGHFDGRTEFGPRALGARSILADARSPEMQVTLNLKIKYRESFRPFAPAVLAEDVSQYFELDRESPYMTLVANVREECRVPFDTGGGEDLLQIVRQSRSRIPAVTHVDYSARIQTIHASDHAGFHAVVRALRDRTGCSVVVNTSFNVRGEPIVNTPQEAYNCFMGTDMDVLVLGSFLLLKEEQPPRLHPKGHLETAERVEELVTMATTPAGECPPALRAIFDEHFVPAAARLREDVRLRFEGSGEAGTNWQDVQPLAREAIFEYPAAFERTDADPATLAKAITDEWTSEPARHALTPVIARLLAARRERSPASSTYEDVPDGVYAMF